MPRTRRNVLQMTALALGGSGLTSLAGCLGGTAGTDETATDGPTTAPSTDDGSDESGESFREWLIDPTNTPLRDGYGIVYHDVAAIRERRDAIHENAYERLKSEMLREAPARNLLDTEDVSATLSLDFEAKIAFGSFDPDAFGERLAEKWNARATSTDEPTTPTRTPRPEPEEYRGFRLFGDRRVYAVSEDIVLLVSTMGRRDGDSLERARAILDARLDGETRYPDGNEYVGAMLGLVEETHALTCYPEAMDGSSSRGFRKDVITGGLKSWRFGPQTTEFTFANTYPDAKAAKNAEFEAYVESDRFDPYDGLDVTTDGKMVWTKGTIPTGEFDHLSPGGPGDSVHTANGNLARR
ncbi:hypothetical protein [Halopelagius longus]|uniref:Uncharacterized protein n=1 Tax=Halopelagius longus TaxID=1236180 RepID=A0A1H0Y6W7_9EURY|nr:hypothetical protein [Halopelagius longus]RDI72312.1 hypothetical protein DWB78_11645 [Halopelagius longus]SDQ10899.1 hypothetical protein SAMN05216278_0442 [Halopelagius longus]